MVSDKQQYWVLRETPQQQAIFNWWIGLELHKGERAALRRCETVSAAMEQVGFHRLSFALRRLTLKVSDEAIANVASVLAYLKPSVDLINEKPEQRFGKLMQNYTTRLAVQMGSERESGAEKPLISELRFQRLLQAASQSDDDFSVQLRRIVCHLDGKATVNPVLVADDIFYRFWALSNPDYYSGSKSFNFKLAKDYYQETFTYQKDEQGA